MPYAGGEKLNVEAAFAAGLIAGAVFLGLELATAFALGAGTPYGPAHVTLRGIYEVEVPPGRLRWTLVLGVLFIHFFLSVLMTVLLAMFTHRQRTEVAVLVGALLGVLLYFGNFYLLVLSLPTLLAAGGLLMLVNYVIFGAVAGWVYKRLEHYFRSASPG